MRNKKVRYLIIAILLTFRIINDHRERNLVDLINYQPKYFYSLGFTKDRSKVLEDKHYEWHTTEQEPTDELLEFLGQYRVQKVKEKIL